LYVLSSMTSTKFCNIVSEPWHPPWTFCIPCFFLTFVVLIFQFLEKLLTTFCSPIIYSIFLLLFQISFFNFYEIYQSVRVFIVKCSETVTNFLCLFSLSYFLHHPSLHVHLVQGLLLFYNVVDVVGGVNTIGIVVKPLLCGWTCLLLLSD
jgi:hypothetical protein